MNDIMGRCDDEADAEECDVGAGRSATDGGTTRSPVRSEWP